MYNSKTMSHTGIRTQEEIISQWGQYSSPLVSICCVTYNHQQYIHEAVNSFLIQRTSFPFEILIHDDASTDGTTDIVLEYAKRYPDIIKPIIQTVNQYKQGGLINPRFVFPKARGKYIALCEGDDYWTDETKLEKQVLFLENNPDYVITYTDCQPFDENGILHTDFGGNKRDLDSIELIKCTPIYTLTACFRNVIKDIAPDLMSARFGDLVIWSLLGAHGRGKYLSEIKPAAYRVHEGGVFSRKPSTQKLEMLLITYNALFAYYMRTGDIEYARHFREKSFLLSRRVIGSKRLTTLIIDSLARVSLNQLRSILSLFGLNNNAG